MSVHYKFKSAVDFSTVTFDGIHISVADLKKEIIEQKRLAKNADFDLRIQNAQSKEVYEDESTLIPKNTSVIVARVPIIEKKRSQGPPGAMGREGRFASQQKNHLASLAPSTVATQGVDLASMDGTEEEKIKAMMSQSTADYDPSRYMKIRGQNQHGKLPDNYRCYKCQQSGHWINNCPMKHHESADIKKSTGIPRSFMVVVDGPEVPGALITPEGQYAVPAIDHEAYLGKNKPQPEPVPKPKIPEELICPLCQDLLTDALLVPCCANSYCDECIRSALLESDEQECPGCKEKDTSPNELIPNRFLRTAVNAFKNETGYSKPVKLPDKKSERESPHKEAQAAAAESRKLSVSLDALEDLPDDLFPHSPRKIEPETEPSDSTKDLYDFNDGSIPSPFARQEGNITPSDHEYMGSGGEHEKYGGNKNMPPYHHQPQQHDSHQQNRDSHQQNREYGRPPPHYRGGPPPHQYNQSDRMHGHPPSHSEPPPPGFGDVLPPGEERPPPRRHPQGPPPHNMMRNDRDRDRERDNRERDDRHMSQGGRPPHDHPPSQGPPGLGPPPGHGPPPPGHGPPPHGPNQHLPGPFNPMQPPPGYPGGPPPPGNAMHPRPPHMSGPPPGPFPPPQYPPPNFNSRMPPPGMNDQMYHQGPYPMDNRHHRDDYRGRPPLRRPFNRDRMGRMPPNDENRPGAIEDPLKEFERIMREKDRRKQQMSGALKKRSKSRTPSPTPRRSASPFRKRSMSPAYPRSPSPKRKRIIPMKRRNSFSRSRSRTPPQPPSRRAPKSRSRSRDRIERDRNMERERVERENRDRNRSMSPHFAKQRRSPRRAPPLAPFTPSPPPPVRYPKKEKEEYFEHHSRYDDRENREGRDSRDNRESRDIGGGGRENRDRHSSRYTSSSSKHHSSSKDYDNKYEEDYNKYPQDRYDAPVRNERHHDQGRYDYNKPSSRNYHNSASHSHRSSSGSAPIPPAPGLRDNRDNRERDKTQNFDNAPPPRRIYEYEPSIVPPGTEQQATAAVPSLFELKIPPPPNVEGYGHSHMRSISSEKSIPLRLSETAVSSKDEVVKPATTTTEIVTEKKETKEHKRRKSSEEKKLLKKEKKKHKKDKKEKKEEKKKRKKSKDGEDNTPLDNIPLELPTLGSIENKLEPIVERTLLETKLTAPCDSTVKSPDRPAKDIVDPQSLVGSDLKVDSKLGIIAPVSSIENDDPFISDRGVVMADLTKQPVDNLNTEKLVHDTRLMEEEKSFVPIPSSKWDFDEGDTSFSGVAGQSPGTTEDKISLKESKVPPDVLRRAENVIFDKPNPITVQTISVSVTEVDNSNHTAAKSPTQIKKITMTDIGTLPEETTKESGRSHSHHREADDGKSKSSSVASAVFRKPVRDRLGNKVSEDEALQSRSKDEERQYTSSRHRRSPVRESKSEKERERIYSRNRSRSPLKLQSRVRSRSPQRRERSRSPIRRERSRSPLQRRGRSRSPQRRDRGIDLRPSDRLERQRGRSSSRGRDEPRTYRRQGKSPLSPLRSVTSRLKSPERDSRRNYDRHQDVHPRTDSSEGRRRRGSGRDEREPSPPGVNEKRPVSSKSESKSRSSDKPHDGAGGVAAAFTNEYAELSARKAKQRINIKLSSTAKLEKDSSSSSEDHEGVGGEEGLASKALATTASAELPGVEAVVLKKKKKEKKRHKSASSTSSSSSSSDEKQKKKKKKSKKSKKKKSKKAK